MKQLISLIKYGFIVGLGMALAACASTGTSGSAPNLDVKTEMSSTIFLNPVAPSNRTVYVQVENTSGQSALDQLKPTLAANLQQKGYRVVDDLNNAHYLLQANVLQAGQIKEGTAKSLLAGGFGGAIAGAAAGSLVGPGDDVDTKNAIAGALIGAAVGAGVKELFKDVTYTITVDLQISERTRHAQDEISASALKQGDSSITAITGEKLTNWERYQTRVVSSVEKVNLKFEEAAPALIQSSAASISGIFS